LGRKGWTLGSAVLEWRLWINRDLANHLASLRGKVDFDYAPQDSCLPTVILASDQQEQWLAGTAENRFAQACSRKRDLIQLKDTRTPAMELLTLGEFQTNFEGEKIGVSECQ